MTWADMARTYSKIRGRPVYPSDIKHIAACKKPSGLNLIIFSRILGISPGYFGHGKVRVALAEAGLKIQDAAKLMKKSKQSMGMWIKRLEKGKNVNADDLRKFAQLTGKPMEYFSK